MLWVIFSFIAIALGIVMFAGIQGDIPDELSWLRSKPTASIVAGKLPSTQEQGKENAPKTAGSVASATSIEGGWTYMAAGAYNFSLTKDMEGQWKSQSPYDKPQFSLACIGGKVYGTILPMLRVSTDSASLTEVALNGKAFKFAVAEPLRLFAPNTDELVALLAKGSTVSVQMNYSELGRQTFSITPAGVSQAYDVAVNRCKK